MEGACACGGASAESRSRVRGSRRRTPFVDHGLHCRMRIRDSDSEIQGRAARGTTRVSVTRPASYKWRSLDLRRSKSEVTTSVELKVWSLDLRRAESEVDLLQSTRMGDFTPTPIVLGVMPFRYMDMLFAYLAGQWLIPVVC